MMELRWKSITYRIILGLLVLSLFGFNNLANTDEEQDAEAAIPKLVQMALAKKLKQFEDQILKKCKQEAIEDAEIYVDSLVSEELKILSGDTLYFPAKPTRPSLPEPIILNDSTGITPILDNG